MNKRTVVKACKIKKNGALLIEHNCSATFWKAVVC